MNAEPKKGDRTGATEAVIDQLIDAKLLELNIQPHGNATGRRLQFLDMSYGEWEAIMRNSMRDMARRVSPDIIVNTPAVVLEQLIIRAESENLCAASLIGDLVNSFMLAYSTPETSRDAFNHLLDLVSLRDNLRYARVAMRD